MRNFDELSERDREIRHHCRLAVPRFGARHDDSLSLPIRERDCRSQCAERFGFDPVGLCVALHRFGSSTAGRFHRTHHRQHRNTKLHPQFIRRAEPVVEHVENVDQPQSATDTEHETDGDDEHQSGR